MGFTAQKHILFCTHLLSVLSVHNLCSLHRELFAVISLQLHLATLAPHLLLTLVFFNPIACLASRGPWKSWPLAIFHRKMQRASQGVQYLQADSVQVPSSFFPVVLETIQLPKSKITSTEVSSAPVVPGSHGHPTGRHR